MISEPQNTIFVAVMKNREQFSARLNELGKRSEPFVFLIDFEGNETLIFDADDTSQLIWKTGSATNFEGGYNKKKLTKWDIVPPTFKQYKKGFYQVSQHIHAGDTYLLNYTQPTKVDCNLNLEDIFHASEASYKILLKDRFVCFSPETFVRITNGKIVSFPMKGTIDASVPNAEQLILNDSKELAEHHTIVDLIRNDLSLVAENVQVEEFRYLERIYTSQHDLWQVSSKISGDLPLNYRESLGDIIFTMLPAGSPKTENNRNNKSCREL